MYFEKLTYGQTEIAMSCFEGEQSVEYNLTILPSPGGTAEEQLEAVRSALASFPVKTNVLRREQCQTCLDLVGREKYLLKTNVSAEDLVFLRFFVSDFANQSEMIKKSGVFESNCAVSIVQQTPLNGSKIGLWACILTGKNGSGFKKEKHSNRLVMTHNGYTHVYTTQLHSKKTGSCSYEQTNAIFSDYLQLLSGQNLRLEEHCLRTWFYVRDIDNNYAGMVKARNQVFSEHRLTRETHFIASTGIEGRYADPSVSVFMDAYAVGGIMPEQVSYLHARENLNPTHEYGVAFERGTAVDYGDRRHIFISGTASIDNKGQIVHQGNIAGQTQRTFENIRALLKEAGAGMDDLGSMIVYLRDTADHDVVSDFISSRYPQIPCIIVHAPVCRPGWLIEAEYMAIKKVKSEKYNCF